MQETGIGGQEKGGHRLPTPLEWGKNPGRAANMYCMC